MKTSHQPKRTEFKMASASEPGTVSSSLYPTTAPRMRCSLFRRAVISAPSSAVFSHYSKKPAVWRAFLNTAVLFLFPSPAEPKNQDECCRGGGDAEDRRKRRRRFRPGRSFRAVRLFRSGGIRRVRRGGRIVPGAVRGGCRFTVGRVWRACRRGRRLGARGRRRRGGCRRRRSSPSRRQTRRRRR